MYETAKYPRIKEGLFINRLQTIEIITTINGVKYEKEQNLGYQVTSMMQNYNKYYTKSTTSLKKIKKSIFIFSTTEFKYH